MNEKQKPAPPANPAAVTDATQREAKDWEPLTDAERANTNKTLEAYEARIVELEQHLAEAERKLVEADAMPKYDPRVIKYAEQFAAHMDKRAAKAEAELKAMMKESGGELFPGKENPPDDEDIPTFPDKP